MTSLSTQKEEFSAKLIMSVKYLSDFQQLEAGKVALIQKETCADLQ